MKVLFVDDEVQVLRGIERMLDAADVDWQCFFANDGHEALAIMEQESINTMVTDMRMPGMDGPELLLLVSEKYPQVVRIVLSGQADRGSVFRAVKPMHQYLAKPTRAVDLVATVERANALNQILDSEPLAKLIGGIDALPSLPETYQKLMDEIDSEEPSLDALKDILSHDPAMTAKILQIVNSAIFGLRNTITCPKQAISLLGINTIKSLALTIGVFQKYEDLSTSRCSVSAMMNHCLEVGVVAQNIVQHELGDMELAAEAFTAGILHDIGKLLLLSVDQKRFIRAIELSEEENISGVDAEKTVWSADHAAVGAYLLTIWGLPQSIVEVVALHHDPLKSKDDQISNLTAICAANEICRNGSARPRRPIERYFESIGCQDKLEEWVSSCFSLADH